MKILRLLHDECAVRALHFDAVAGLHRCGQIHKHTVANDFFDFAKVDTALFSEPGMDKLLVVIAAKPASKGAESVEASSSRPQPASVFTAHRDGDALL